jgi:hypothetical protein
VLDSSKNSDANILDDGGNSSFLSVGASAKQISETFVSVTDLGSTDSTKLLEDNKPKYTTYQGSCGVFHEGLLIGSGPGISKFTAQSIDECWSLCETRYPECSQIEFLSGTSECVLGDAITTTFHVDSSVSCRTLDYIPIESSNGLSGMIFVDSVRDVEFTPPQLVDSLEECQALCKSIDAAGSDSACMFGGYVDCTNISSYCSSMDGAGNVDCQKCQANTNGGICRLPSMQSTTATTSLSVCTGNQCRWFEKSAQGFSLVIKTPTRTDIDYIPKLGQICDSRSYLPNPIVIQEDEHSCYYPVESLWHCQSLCTASNRLNGSGKNNCVGGLYTDTAGNKRCHLATYRSASGRTCIGNNCAWFELDGIGRIDRLQDTGMKLAIDARSLSPMLYEIGVGGCAQFKTFGPRMKKSISQVLYKDPIKECSIACSLFPQCTAFQVTGRIEGRKPNNCDITKGTNTDCTSVECVLSSALTTVLPTNGEKNQICWSKTPTGTVDTGGESVDYDNVDPGIPGFVTTNARVRKFSWNNVVGNQLALTTSMEECQSVCRATDGCQTGTWQPCSAIQSYCTNAEQLNIATPETIATCNVCKSVKVSENQQEVAFPINYGVCKVASGINLHVEACQPEPCYSFETGSDEFYILSMTKNPFATDASPHFSFNGEINTYTKAGSLLECQEYCKRSPGDRCRYGMYIPRSNGYGECYLTESEIRENHGSFWRLKQDTTLPCDGTCVTFIKLKNVMPPQFTGAT